jgi:NADPH:quinone reductase-like Zn-dependent oxidoreductase
MKAIVQEKYGSPYDVLNLKDIDKPMLKDDEVLVRVHTASVHPDVWHVVRGLPYVLRLMGAGLLKPKNRVPGTDVAGHVELVGKNVSQFQQGDEVFGETIKGYQWSNGGAYAEYVSVPERLLALKPANITFEQAAAVPTSGLIALQNLPNEGRLHPGQSVLVNGAGGGVGALAVQIAKAYGANVTGVDDTTKLEMVRSLGADQGIDYTKEDFTQGGERYDLIFDIPGNHPFSACRRVLAPNGKYVLIGHDRAGSRTLVRKHPPRPETGRALPVPEPAADPDLFNAGQEKPYGCLEAAYRDWEDHTGHRHDVPVERGPRGHQVSGTRTRTGESRHHRVRRTRRVYSPNIVEGDFPESICRTVHIALVLRRSRPLRTPKA